MALRQGTGPRRTIHPHQAGASPGPAGPSAPYFGPISALFTALPQVIRRSRPFRAFSKTPRLKSVMKNTLEQKQQHHGRMQPGERFASMSRLSAHAIGCFRCRQTGERNGVITRKRERGGDGSDAIGQLSEWQIPPPPETDIHSSFTPSEIIYTL